ncbi:MAG: hypothetical protein IJ785_06040 [Bacteroidales bacterium]|nr:hypothetical protein [Bacteroidales bacterium]
MKKTLVSLLSLLALSSLFTLSSCQKEATGDGTQFRATMEDCTSQDGKTVLNGTALNWVDGDQIAVYGRSGRGLYSATPGTPATTAVFDNVSGRTGKGPYRAFYPSTITSDGVNITLPSVQFSEDGSLSGFPMYAECNNDQLSFKNLCGVIKVHLQKTGVNVSSIEVTASSDINGVYSIRNNGVPTITLESNGSNTTELVCTTPQSISNGADFYIYLPHGNYSSMTFTIKDEDGNVCTKSSKTGVSIYITRSQFTTINFSDNDLVFVEDLPRIEVDLDPTNPMIACILNETADTAYIFGTKDNSGRPLKVSNVLIKEHDKAINTDIFFDTLERPIEIWASNGVIMQLNWLDNESAALALIDPASGEQLNTIAYFNSNNTADGAKGGNGNAGTARTDSTILTVRPMFPESGNANGLSKDGPYITGPKTGDFWVNQCGVPTDAQCWIDVYDHSNMTGSYGYGKFRTRIPVNTKIGTGHYSYYIPNGIMTHHNIDLDDYCDVIANVMGKVCFVNELMSAGGCAAISVALAFAGVTAVSAPGFFLACERITVALDVVCAFFTDVPGSTGTSIADGICGLLRNKKIAWNTPLYLSPVVCAIPQNIKGLPVVYDGEHGLPDLNVSWGGTPRITDFTLNPPAPLAYVGYDAVANLYCLPAGTIITMSIVGTDGYSNSKTYTVGDEVHYVATLYVPGSYAGVRDVCTVRLDMPDGSSLSRTAQLYFH